MKENSYLKDCWQTANESWQAAPRGQSAGSSLEDYLRRYCPTEDRPAEFIADSLKQTANRAIFAINHAADYRDYIADVAADYRKRAEVALKAYNDRLEQVANNDDIKAGLLAIEKLDAQRAETLAALDKSSPSYSDNLLAIQYHTRAKKLAKIRDLEAKIKARAAADETANRLWREHCGNRETADKLARNDR